MKGQMVESLIGDGLIGNARPESFERMFFSTQERKETMGVADIPAGSSEGGRARWSRP
jgi:hypothetical protein